MNFFRICLVAESPCSALGEKPSSLISKARQVKENRLGKGGEKVLKWFLIWRKTTKTKQKVGKWGKKDVWNVMRLYEPKWREKGIAWMKKFCFWFCFFFVFLFLCSLYHQFEPGWTISFGQTAKGIPTSKASKMAFVDKLNKQLDTRPRGFNLVENFPGVNK